MYKNKYFPITLDTIKNDLYREAYFLFYNKDVTKLCFYYFLTTLV